MYYANGESSSAEEALTALLPLGGHESLRSEDSKDLVRADLEFAKHWG